MVTRATTGAGEVTATDAEPLMPSLVAVMFAAPVPTAVTTPEPFTDATEASELVQVTVRPVSGLPAASRSVTVADVVPPTVRLEAPSDTLTAATGAGGGGGGGGGGGAVTVTDALPFTPSLVAVMVAPPAASAVTVPLPETDATEPFELVQLTTRPVSGLPAASRSVTVAAVVPPTSRLDVPNVTLTVATGAGGGATTETLAKPFTPPLAAMIVADPGATAVT